MDQAIQFNNETYIQKLIIARLNDAGQYESFIPWFERAISEITIINDLNHPLPMLEVFIRDPQARVMPRYALDGRTFLEVYIEYTHPQQNDDTADRLCCDFVFLSLAEVNRRSNLGLDWCWYALSSFTHDSVFDTNFVGCFFCLLSDRIFYCCGKNQRNGKSITKYPHRIYCYCGHRHSDP